MPSTTTPKPAKATPRKRQATKAQAAKPKAAKPKAAKTTQAKGSWASRNPKLVATIPARIAAGQHPKQAAAEWGISLEITWRLFKQQGWQATGGKGFAFKTQADKRKAQQALNTLTSLGKPSLVIRALEREAATN